MTLCLGLLDLSLFVFAFIVRVATAAFDYFIALFAHMSLYCLHDSFV